MGLSNLDLSGKAPDEHGSQQPGMQMPNAKLSPTSGMKSMVGYSDFLPYNGSLKPAGPQGI